MKVKATRKAIKEVYSKIIRVGYCNIQFLLNFEEPTYYCTRSEGWACDVYVFGDTAISTGYAPFGNIDVPYSVEKEFDNKAAEICAKTNDYLAAKDKLKHLIDEFIQAAVTGR